MKEKMIYEAPEVEVVKLSAQAGVLTFSDPVKGKGKASANAMEDDNTTFGSSW